MPFPFKPKQVIVDVFTGEEETHPVKFVPVQLKFLYPLKQLGKQIADALSDLGSAKRLVEGKRQDVSDFDPHTKSMTHSEVVTEPVDPGKIEKGAVLRRQATEKIIGLFLEEKSLTTLTDMICSSLRANDDEWKLESSDLRELGDIDLITQLTIGMVEAHQGVLDPLLRMRGLAATVSESASGPQLVPMDEETEETEESEEGALQNS